MTFSEIPETEMDILHNQVRIKMPNQCVTIFGSNNGIKIQTSYNDLSGYHEYYIDKDKAKELAHFLINNI